MHSPFIYNNPVINEYFFNRDKLIEDILDYTFLKKDLGNIWLYGERQVGKTSLLKHLEAKCKNNNLKTYTEKEVKLIYFDCQGIHDKENTLNEIAFKINLDLQLINTTKAFDLFNSVFEKILEKNIYIVLLLDEFDSLLSYYDVNDKKSSAYLLKNLRSNSNSIQKLPGQPKLMSVVFASNSNYKELTNPFKNIGSPLNCLEIEMDWFMEYEIEKLLKKYLPKESGLFNNDDLILCFKLSHGHPMLIQKTLELLYNSKKATKIIDEKEIEKEINKFIMQTNSVWLNMKLPRKIIKRIQKFGKNFKVKFGVNIGKLAIEIENK